MEEKQKQEGERAGCAGGDVRAAHHGTRVCLEQAARRR